MKSLQNPSRQIMAILVLFPLSITVICGLLLALILGLYRLAHKLAAYLLRPDLEGMLPPLENLMAHDKLDKPTGNICVLLTIDGRVSLECMRSEFLKNVVLERRSDFKLNYPELQKYWTSFGSYKFWKSDLNFDVENHVRELDYEFYDSYGNVENFSKRGACTEEDLQKIFTRLQVHPLRENQSPWEMLLIPNQSEENPCKTTFIFRLHHTIGDGYTIHKLLQKIFQGTRTDSSGPVEKNREKMSAWQQFKFAIAAVHQLAFEVLDLLCQFSLDKHDWMGHSKDPACSYFTTWTEGVDMDIVKRIKRDNGVSFNAVAITAVLNTFQRLVQDAGLECPGIITAFFPVPLPNSSSGLRMNSSAVPVKFSLASGNSGVNRLTGVEKTLKGIGRLLPGFIFNALKLYGMFPSIVLSRSKIFGCTIGLTSIPGPQDTLCIRGAKLERVLSNFPIGPTEEGGGGCTVTAISSFGKMRIVMTLTTATWPFPPEILQKNFNRYIQEEIEGFRRLSYIPLKPAAAS